MCTGPLAARRHDVVVFSVKPILVSACVYTLLTGVVHIHIRVNTCTYIL